MQFEKHTLVSFSYTREFFKDFKLHSSFGLVQFRSSLKNSLVHVFSKLHSKPYYYLYSTHCWFSSCVYSPRWWTKTIDFFILPTSTEVMSFVTAISRDRLKTTNNKHLYCNAALQANSESLLHPNDAFCVGINCSWIITTCVAEVGIIKNMHIKT